MINRFKWLGVKPETRRNIVAFLNSVDGFPKLTRSGSIEVVDNQVVCDGFMDQDLCVITNELLVAALGAKTLEDAGINTVDTYAMFYELVRRLESTPVEIKSEEPKAEEPKAEEPKAEEPKAEEPKVEVKSKKSNK